MNTKIVHSNGQSGAVSLFVVIFAALLMTVVTVSFIQLMVKDQEQATASDLSQSAYDSAQAGVEDAKRLLLAIQECGESNDVTCRRYREAALSGDCSTLSAANLVASVAGETLIQQTGLDASLDQAYTCVKINLNPEEYRRTILRNESIVIPLKAVAEFNRVEISWFTRTNAGSNTVSFGPIGQTLLPPIGDRWSSSRPALLRTQLFQTGESFQLTDFDDIAGASTLFLYPGTVGSKTGSFDQVGRRSSTMAPVPVSCNPSFGSGEMYACRMTLELPAPKNGSLMNRGAYLQLGALYNDSQVQIKLLSPAGRYVNFDSIQSVVDSTGRANDLFRRVEARVDLTGTMPYPAAAIDIADDLCKDFFITDDPGEYVSTCTP